MAVICDNAAARAFHVHTYRCRHAENVPDDAYVVKAMELGASEIWFTDHCPFPGDPFGNRMGWDELGEYVSTLRGLRDRYPDIDIHIGLEAEYFPTYDEQGLYTMLTKDMGIEYLLLGQHMAQIGSDPPAYSFSLDKDELIRREYRLLGGATVQGIESGRFSAVAHPTGYTASVPTGRRIWRRQPVRSYPQPTGHICLLSSTSPPWNAVCTGRSSGIWCRPIWSASQALTPTLYQSWRSGIILFLPLCIDDLSARKPYTMAFRRISRLYIGQEVVSAVASLVPCPLSLVPLDHRYQSPISSMNSLISCAICSDSLSMIS